MRSTVLLVAFIGIPTPQGKVTAYHKTAICVRRLPRAAIAPYYKTQDLKPIYQPEHKMQINNRLLDDLTRVTNSALGTMTGIKGEVDALVRQQFEKILVNMDLVTREEFDVVRDIATKATQRAETLETQVSSLEDRLAKLEAAATPAPKAASKAPKTTKDASAPES
jgi:BMFP domain-containing protein YqiC